MKELVFRHFEKGILALCGILLLGPANPLLGRPKDLDDLEKVRALDQTVSHHFETYVPELPAVPDNVVWISARPPFPVEAEVALLRRHEVQGLFVQASGGEITYTKLAAARALGLPVAMLTRPQPPEGAAGSVPEALAWLARLLGRST